MEAILVVGLIALVIITLFRLITVVESLFDNKRIVTTQLSQMVEVAFSPEHSHKREYLYLLNEKLSKELNIKPPPIYVQDSGTDNATAVNTGFFQAVIFEVKTLEGLNDKGLGAVLAHELFHIKEKHYLKSLARMFFISTSWILFNIFILMSLADQLNFPEPTTKAENYYFIFSIMMFFAGSSLIGDHLALIFDRFIGRKQEIECDIYSAKATCFEDYITEAEYFQNGEGLFWSRPLSPLNAIKAQMYYTHPNWDKRIGAVVKALK